MPTLNSKSKRQEVSYETFLAPGQTKMKVDDKGLYDPGETRMKKSRRQTVIDSSSHEIYILLDWLYPWPLAVLS